MALRTRTEATLTHLLATNANTRYVRESPVFTDFRTALDANDRSIIQAFRDTVPLTGYDSYEPFVNQMLDPTLREKDVKDINANSTPSTAIPNSPRPKTSTSMPTPSHPKAERIASSTRSPITASVDVINDDETRVAQFPLTSMSAGVIRMEHGMTVDKDPWLITGIAPRATSPIAISFIANYRSFLLMHLLFALADPDLENISYPLWNRVYRHDALHGGRVGYTRRQHRHRRAAKLGRNRSRPELPRGRPSLCTKTRVFTVCQPRFPARPQRATHIRAVGKATDQPGWLKMLWPRLNVVIGIASGVFAGVIPKMQHYLGPDVHMTSLGFTASEAYVGTAYSHTDLNLFKATNDDIIEYLDISAGRNLHPIWPLQYAYTLLTCHEVKIGHRYEIVVTTRDGLWRYRLGDVVEIADFDPIDDSPILRYVERRGAFLRLTSGMISEEQLKTAIFSAQDVLGTITEFTVIVDERKMPPSLAYLVEIDGELAPSASQAPARIEADLADANENVTSMLDKGKLGPLAVYVLQPGTFREFRYIKVKATVTGTGIGQIKVPVVLWDHEMQAWMLGRVHKVLSRASAC
ncbi:GH3 auxin-responsive promoter [Chiua virens]|nr:GH3 auxin-responsive promoter [Chiua virens]